MVFTLFILSCICVVGHVNTFKVCTLHFNGSAIFFFDEHLPHCRLKNSSGKQNSCRIITVVQLFTHQNPAFWRTFSIQRVRMRSTKSYTSLFFMRIKTGCIILFFESESKPFFCHACLHIEGMCHGGWYDNKQWHEQQSTINTTIQNISMR